MAVELLAGERLDAESNKAIVACNDYVGMGVGRSLQKLCDRYQTAPGSPPTKRLKTLKDWSAAFAWQARAEAYDKTIEIKKGVRRKEVMESGLALDYERVVKLKTLADFLESLINQVDHAGKRPSVWVKDYKQIGSGEFAEKVEIERFNAPLISEFRATLDDLAKEAGGRAQKVEMEHSGSVDISADERAEAAKELDLWQQQKKNDAATSNG